MAQLGSVRGVASFDAALQELQRNYLPVTKKFIRDYTAIPDKSDQVAGTRQKATAPRSKTTLLPQGSPMPPISVVVLAAFVSLSDPALPPDRGR